MAGRPTVIPPPAQLLARVALAAVFFYAGLSKLASPADFAVSIENYRLLPCAPAGWVALYLPWLETGCALGLFIPRLRLGSAAVLAVLCAMFCGFIASALLRGLDISCGCFGGGADARAGLRLPLLRAALLLAASVWLLVREARRITRFAVARCEIRSK
jgi:uncharacterized membrane protein YphA (DoxX/SURF4 family)